MAKVQDNPSTLKVHYNNGTKKVQMTGDPYAEYRGVAGDGCANNGCLGITPKYVLCDVSGIEVLEAYCICTGPGNVAYEGFSDPNGAYILTQRSLSSCLWEYRGPASGRYRRWTAGSGCTILLQEDWTFTEVRIHLHLFGGGVIMEMVLLPGEALYYFYELKAAPGGCTNLTFNNTGVVTCFGGGLQGPIVDYTGQIITTSLL